MATLRTRKIIYTTVTLIASAIWLPVMVMGMIMGIGVLGVFSVLSLLRCIRVMPVERGFARRFYTVMICLGIVMLIPCMWVVATGADALTAGPWTLLISGALLIASAVLVLIELHRDVAGRGR